jgi:hypothetical protein
VNAIPWYQSRVFIGAVVSIISQLLVLIGKQDVIPVDVITSNVEALFQIIALAAAGYAAWKRKTSDIQPLTITKAAAEKQSSSSGYVSIALLFVIAAAASVMLLSACQTTPASVVEVACKDASKTPERCAKGIGETWEVYQKRAEELVTDSSTPADLKYSIQRAERATRPVVVEMLRSAAIYTEMKQQLSAGATTEEKVRIANANLAEWVSKALPQIEAFGDTLGL